MTLFVLIITKLNPGNQIRIRSTLISNPEMVTAILAFWKNAINNLESNLETIAC